MGGGHLVTLDLCAQCGQTGSYHCGSCKHVRYCGSACQNAHWKSSHRAVCPTLKACTKEPGVFSAPVGRRGTWYPAPCEAHIATHGHAGFVAAVCAGGTSASIGGPLDEAADAPQYKELAESLDTSLKQTRGLVAQINAGTLLEFMAREHEEYRADEDDADRPPFDVYDVWRALTDVIQRGRSALSGSVLCALQKQVAVFVRYVARVMRIETLVSRAWDWLDGSRALQAVVGTLEYCVASIGGLTSRIMDVMWTALEGLASVALELKTRFVQAANWTAQFATALLEGVLERASTFSDEVTTYAHQLGCYVFALATHTATIGMGYLKEARRVLGGATQQLLERTQSLLHMLMDPAERAGRWVAGWLEAHGASWVGIVNFDTLREGNLVDQLLGRGARVLGTLLSRQATALVTRSPAFLAAYLTRTLTSLVLNLPASAGFQNRVEATVREVYQTRSTIDLAAELVASPGEGTAEAVETLFQDLYRKVALMPGSVEDTLEALRTAEAWYRERGEDTQARKLYAIYASLVKMAGGFAPRQAPDLEDETDNRATWTSLRTRFAANLGPRLWKMSRAAILVLYPDALAPDAVDELFTVLENDADVDAFCKDFFGTGLTDYNGRLLELISRARREVMRLLHRLVAEELDAIAADDAATRSAASARFMDAIERVGVPMRVSEVGDGGDDDDDDDDTVPPSRALVPRSGRGGAIVRRPPAGGQTILKPVDVQRENIMERLYDMREKYQNTLTGLSRYKATMLAVMNAAEERPTEFANFKEEIAKEYAKMEVFEKLGSDRVLQFLSEKQKKRRKTRILSTGRATVLKFVIPAVITGGLLLYGPTREMIMGAFYSKNIEDMFKMQSIVDSWMSKAAGLFSGFTSSGAAMSTIAISQWLVMLRDLFVSVLLRGGAAVGLLVVTILSLLDGLFTLIWYYDASNAGTAVLQTVSSSFVNYASTVVVNAANVLTTLSTFSIASMTLQGVFDSSATGSVSGSILSHLPYADIAAYGLSSVNVAQKTMGNVTDKMLERLTVTMKGPDLDALWLETDAQRTLVKNTMDTLGTSMDNVIDILVDMRRARLREKQRSLQSQGSGRQQFRLESANLRRRGRGNKPTFSINFAAMTEEDELEEDA